MTTSTIRGSKKTETFTRPAFQDFLIRDKSNRWYLYVGMSASILLWIGFKLLYPHANIVFDSCYYIYAAMEGFNVSAWPIGYSKFLAFIGLFTHSVSVVLAIQYFLLQVCLLVFFISMRYFFSPGRWASLVLFVLLLGNPIYLYTCNFVLSDTLFLALSLLWLVQLFWIIFRPRAWMIWTQALLLLLVFTIRHGALFYPVVSCLAFSLSKLRVPVKLAGMLLSCGVIGGFMLYTTWLNEKEFGIREFSPFQSWKVASNALYIYEHVPREDRRPVPAEFWTLDSVVRNYYDTPHEPVDILKPDPSTGSYYMFMWNSPLMTYRDMRFGPERLWVINLRTLAKLGPLYNAYGSFLLKHYPVPYFRHFVLPNVLLYMLPYPEVYTDTTLPFTLGTDTLGKMARRWFGVKSLAASPGAKKVMATIFDHYTGVDTMTHLGFLLGLVCFLILGGPKIVGPLYARAVWLVAALWAMNFFFLVMASASLYRYLLFIVVVETGFAGLFIDFLVKVSRRTQSPTI